MASPPTWLVFAVLLLSLTQRTTAWFTILHSNAIRGLFAGVNGTTGGIARLKTVFDQYPDAIKLNTHGYAGGSEVFAGSRGAAETDFMNALGFDASSLGTTELALGIEQLYTNVLSRAKFPIIASDFTFATRSNLPSKVQTHAVLQAFDRDANRLVRVGVVSIGQTNQCHLVNCSDNNGPIIQPAVSTTAQVQQQIDMLKRTEGVEFIVALGTSWNPNTDIMVAQTLSGIDLLLLGSIEPPSLFPQVSNLSSSSYPWVTQDAEGRRVIISWTAGTGGAMVSAISVSFSSDTRTPVVVGKQVSVSCKTPGNNCVAESPILNDSVPASMRQVASNAAALPFSISLSSDLRHSDCVRQECALGSFIASALRATGKCQFSIVSVANLVGTSVSSPDIISWSGLRSIYPFEDQVAFLTLTSADVIDFIARSLQDDFVQASGVIIQSSDRRLTNVVVNGSSLVSSPRADITICTQTSLLSSLPRDLISRIRYGLNPWNINVLDAIYLFYTRVPTFSFIPSGVFESESKLPAVTGLCTYNGTASSGAFTDSCTGHVLGTDYTVHLSASSLSRRSAARSINLTVSTPGTTGSDTLYVYESGSTVPSLVQPAPFSTVAIPFTSAAVRFVSTAPRTTKGLSYSWAALSSCPDGYISGTNGTCSICPAGYYANSSLPSSSNTCGTCPAGFYSATGASLCLPCASGTASSQLAAGNCSACQDPTVQPYTGQTTCVTCAAPRIRLSSSLCVCPSDDQAWDAASSTCMSLTATQTLMLTASLLAGLSAIFLLLTLILMWIWTKRRRVHIAATSYKEITVQPTAGSSQVPQTQLISIMGVQAPEDSLEAPIEKAIDILHSLKSASTNARFVKQIDHVLGILAAGDMYTSHLENMTSGNMDDDVKDWIATTVIGKRPSGATAASSTRQRHGSTARMKVDGHSASIVADALQATEYIAKDVFMMEVSHVTCILEHLQRCAEWDFDVFSFTEATNGHPLLFLSYYMIKKLHLLHDIKIEDIALLQYLDEVEMSYQHNPYHNSIHAADMLQAMWVFLQDERFKGVFSPVELFAIIIACVIHDVDHPGVTNAFIIKSRNPLALLYSDTSVLEFHHAATGVTIAERRQLFNKLGPIYDDLRKIIIDLVLATDMGKHFEYLNRFKSQISTLPENPKAMSLDKPETKMLVLHIGVKCSDLNNPTRPRVTSLEWTSRIMEEFYCQGDQEREAGFPISKFMDRESKADENVAKCQSSFIDVIVGPLYQAWTSYLLSPTASNITDNIQSNRQFWSQAVRSRDNLVSPSPPPPVKKQRTERAASFAAPSPSTKRPMNYLIGMPLRAPASQSPVEGPGAGSGTPIGGAYPNVSGSGSTGPAGRMRATSENVSVRNPSAGSATNSRSSVGSSVITTRLQSLESTSGHNPALEGIVEDGPIATFIETLRRQGTPAGTLHRTIRRNSTQSPQVSQTVVSNTSSVASSIGQMSTTPVGAGTLRSNVPRASSTSSAQGFFNGPDMPRRGSASLQGLRQLPPRSINLASNDRPHEHAIPEESELSIAAHGLSSPPPLD